MSTLSWSSESCIAVDESYLPESSCIFHISYFDTVRTTVAFVWKVGVLWKQLTKKRTAFTTM